jgi:hypothetical protein
MRHASPVMTLGTYAKAVTADKRLAQDAIAALFAGKALRSPSINVTTLLDLVVRAKLLKILVGTAGFEPTASAVWRYHSTRILLTVKEL